MKNKKANPAASKFSVLKQICNFIPPHLVSKLARETGAADKARDFSNWSHVVALISAQLSHSIGLNDVCDSLQLNQGSLAAIRGASAPSPNGLSHANKVRPAEMGQKLFWTVLDSLGENSPDFFRGQAPRHARRFKTPIHIIDTTVIELAANAMDWAKQRRRKAAAKAHMRLNLLPQCVIIDTAKEHDNLRARELCAGIKEGEIVKFDKGYLDFDHLRDLDERGVNWVTRAKENLNYEVVETFSTGGDPKILTDEVIQPQDPRKSAPEIMRRVGALVQVDGQNGK